MLKCLYFKRDERFKVEFVKSGWCYVYKDNKLIAKAIDFQTARQVIYTVLKNENKKPEHINKDDFSKE